MLEPNLDSVKYHWDNRKLGFRLQPGEVEWLVGEAEKVAGLEAEVKRLKERVRELEAEIEQSRRD